MSNEGLTNKERTIIFGPIILVLIIVSFFFKFKQTSKDDFYNEIVPWEFKGKIVEKYRHFNHDEPRIKYQSENEVIDISAFNWIDLYENTEIGDSIFKNRGDMVLCVKKLNSDTIYKINYFLDKGWGIVKR